MLDRFSRSINYLRISVTDRCNLRCNYCMPEEGIKLLSHNDILSFDEIVEFVEVAAELGVNKVRLTGGEPLVRKGFVDLVKMIAKIPGIEDLSMTTNAILLSQFAQQLKDAGFDQEGRGAPLPEGKGEQEVGLHAKLTISTLHDKEIVLFFIILENGTLPGN